MRDLYFTDEFKAFKDGSDSNVQKKIEYIFEILKTQDIINTKIVKKLVNTYFYEMRIKLSNEYRVLLFTIDHENINQSKQILFLNGFMKKSTKDYSKQIQLAEKILEKWQQ